MGFDLNKELTTLRNEVRELKKQVCDAQIQSRGHEESDADIWNEHFFGTQPT